MPPGVFVCLQLLRLLMAEGAAMLIYPLSIIFEHQRGKLTAKLKNEALYGTILFRISLAVS